MTRPQFWACDPVNQYKRTKNNDKQQRNNASWTKQVQWVLLCCPAISHKMNHPHVTELTDSLVAVCNMCAKSLAALFFDTYFNTRWENSSSRSRLPSNAVGPMSSAMYFHNCGMSISRSSANVNICSTLKRDHKKEIIRVKWILQPP